MMDSMIKAEGLTFKDLEEKIFRRACSWARGITKEVLEGYDQYLMETRDKKTHRHKGYRRTTVKTRYGEVEYRRAIYEKTDEDGFRRFVYLLDETLDLKETGLISTGMAEILVKGIMDLSYRKCAAKVTEMTGQSISAMGVWNVIQALGQKVCEEETELVEAHKAGQVKGETKTPVLFEETDGVYLSLQGKDRIQYHHRKAEMKVGIAYDGWRPVGKDKYELTDKVVVAGFSKAKDFQEYREAAIAEKYDLDEVDLRILNGDGASWIKKVKDKDTVFQLDPFHRNKAVKEKITDKRAVRDILDLLEKREIDEVFRYLEIYRDSISEEKEIEKADELIQYFRNNESGLVPYQWQEEIPESPEGKEYRNMGTMENHIWSLIAYRMNGRHASWSICGGHNLAKLLAKRGCGRLGEVLDPLKRPVFAREVIEEMEPEILSAGRIAKKIGEGYAYPTAGHLAGLDTETRGDRRKLLAMAGF